MSKLCNRTMKLDISKYGVPMLDLGSHLLALADELFVWPLEPLALSHKNHRLSSSPTTYLLRLKRNV